MQEYVDAQSAQAQLQAEGIATSVSLITSTRLDFEARRLPDALIRASIHYYNSPEVCHAAE